MQTSNPQAGKVEDIMTPAKRLDNEINTTTTYVRPPAFYIRRIVPHLHVHVHSLTSHPPIGGHL